MQGPPRLLQLISSRLTAKTTKKNKETGLLKWHLFVVVVVLVVLLEIDTANVSEYSEVITRKIM